MINLPTKTSIRLIARSSRIIKILEAKFDGDVEVTNGPKLKVLVHSTSFHNVPEHNQVESVLDALPIKWRKDVDVQTNTKPGVTDSKLARVKLQNFNVSTGLVTSTPQSLLDCAVTHAKRGETILSSESLWLSGSLALKMFGRQYGVDTKSHRAKNILVSTIAMQFGDDLLNPWAQLEKSLENSYDNTMEMVQLRKAMEETELFCNTLFEYDALKTFNFFGFLPRWLLEEEEIKKGVMRPKYARHFRIQKVAKVERAGLLNSQEDSD